MTWQDTASGPPVQVGEQCGLWSCRRGRGTLGKVWTGHLAEEELDRDVTQHLHCFWIRFSISTAEETRYPSYVGLRLGCGVTAYSLDDVERLLGALVFGGDPIAAIKEVVVDVQLRDLDQRHVVANMGPANERGVWFPRRWPSQNGPAG